jgi:hypothetical protein
MSTKAPRENDTKEMIDEKLDRALQDTFPASDPVAFIEPAPGKQGGRAHSSEGGARDPGKGRAARG